MTIETELPAVKVKALEWPSECPRGRRVSGNGLVVYCIAHYGGGIGDPIYRWAAPLSSWSKPFYSFDEAKAGAQADYERRILSALTPSPLPQVVRLLRSLEAIAEDFIPDRDEDAPLALQEMRDAIRAVIAATEALDNG